MWQAINNSVRYRLIMVVLTTNLVALLVAGVALVYYDLRNYQTILENELVTQAEILGRASAPALEFDDAKSAEVYLSLLNAEPVIRAAAIYSSNGKLFASYTSQARPAKEFPALPDVDGVRVNSDVMELFMRIVEDNEILGSVYLRAGYQQFERMLRYLGILGTVLLLSMIAAFLMATWLQATVTRPILDITDIARQVMSSRNYSLRANKTTDDEIGYLVDAFNDMLSEIGNRATENEVAKKNLEHENHERIHAEEEMRKLNAELEERVFERTEQLQSVNKELEAFSYSVSHDLRAPLRAITGFSNLLIRDHGEELNKEAARKLEVIIGESQRMGTLIDDLLAFSRLGRKVIQLADLDMTEMAQSTFDDLYKQNDGPAVEFKLATLPRGKGDRSLLGQVWTNLLSNALKFSSNRKHPVIEVNAISDEQEYIYFIRDNGAGFDPRYQSKLFEVFQRLHDANEFPGTGVGLALVQRIITRHGGRVWAESKPDAGATFYFSLPREKSDERI